MQQGEVIAIHFPQATIAEAEVGSGVSDQPFGDEETRLGAMNRALWASSLKEGAIGIGLEGGVRLLEGQMYLCNWGALVLPDGTKFTAGGAQIPLPQQLRRAVERQRTGTGCRSLISKRLESVKKKEQLACSLRRQLNVMSCLNMFCNC